MQSGNLAVSDVAVAQAIAAAVSAVPGVAELSPGQSGEVATYGAHTRVRGVIVRKTDAALDIDVHVCAAYTTSLDLKKLASQVREATLQSLEATGAMHAGRIDVVIDDLRVGGDPR